jgi:hypothetical protein
MTWHLMDVHDFSWVGMSQRSMTSRTPTNIHVILTGGRDLAAWQYASWRSVPQ